MTRDSFGAVVIVSIIVLSVMAAWFLCYVAKVEWFRTRLIHGDRTQRMIAMLPIVVPAYLIAALIL